MEAALNERLNGIEQALRLLRTPMPSRCLTCKEAAEVLGLGVAAVQGLVNAGELPALRLTFGARKVYRIQLTDLEAFIDRKKKPPTMTDEGSIEIRNFED